MRTGTARHRSAQVVISLLTGLLVGAIVGGGIVYLFGGKRVAKTDVTTPKLKVADELALVPADASAFVHIRAAEMWKHPALAEFRKLVDNAGPEPLKSLDDSFLPAPSSLDRITVVALRPEVPKPKPVERPPGKPPQKGAVKAGPPTPPMPPPPPEIVALIAFSAPFDANKVVQVNFPSATKKMVADKPYWHDQDSDTAIYFPASHGQVIVIGTGKGVELFMARTGKTEGPLAPALKLASEGERHIAGGLNFKDGDLTDALRNLLPEDAKPYFGPIFHANSLTGSVIIDSDKTKLEIRLSYPDAKEADDAMQKLRANSEKARQALAEPKKRLEDLVKGTDPSRRSFRKLPIATAALVALGTVNLLEAILKDPPLKVEGSELVAEFMLPSAGDLALMADAAILGFSIVWLGEATEAFKPQPVPTVIDKQAPKPGPNSKGPLKDPDPTVAPMPKVSSEDAAARMQSSKNLKELALGMFKHEAEKNRFPAAAIYDDDGKAMLSWRVAILPYIGQKELYDEFKLDEPWDSDSNKKLLRKMPKVFANPRAPAEEGKTYYKVFVGPSTGIGAAFTNQSRGRKITDFLDGTSNTVLIIEGGPAVEWTKPEEIPFSPTKNAPELSITGKSDICVAMADGSVHVVNWNKLPNDVRKAAITLNGDDPYTGFGK